MARFGFRRDAIDKRRVVTERSTAILGSRMSYAEAGEGPAIIFLSGSFAGAYMWRNVIPHVAHLGHCIAPDLPGTGLSERQVVAPLGAYPLEQQRLHFRTFLDSLQLEAPFTLVVHGWASMVGFDFAANHPEHVHAVCHMESVLRPLVWPDLSARARDVLRLIRSPEGLHMFISQDVLFDRFLRRQVTTPIRGQDLNEYRKRLGPPGDARMATYGGWRSIPIGGDPPEAREMVAEYSGWIQDSDTPKLMIQGHPGFLTTGRHAASGTGFTNQETVKVAGTHLITEDSPDGVGLYLSRFISGVHRD